MFDQRTAQLAGASVPQGQDGRERAVVALLIKYYSDDLFKAALQVWTAAAADVKLRQQILPLEREFARRAHELAVELLHADDSEPRTHTMIQATLDLARGLGLASVLTDDSARRAHVVAVWADQLVGLATTPSIDQR